MVQHRYSQQREKIYQVVMASHEHPTAQMVYETLQQEMPQLSLGTVYRNLRQLAREGSLRELDGATVRFDGNVQPHSHIRCTCCGALADTAVPYDPRLDHSTPAEGWTIQDHDLIFHGICPICAGRSHE